VGTVAFYLGVVLKGLLLKWVLDKKDTEDRDRGR
jgi:hypothetical protein